MAQVSDAPPAVVQVWCKPAAAAAAAQEPSAAPSRCPAVLLCCWPSSRLPPPPPPSGRRLWLKGSSSRFRRCPTPCASGECHAMRLRSVPRRAPPECAPKSACAKKREREHFVKSVSVHCAHVVLCLVLAVASVCSQGHQGRPSFVVVVSPSPSFPPASSFSSSSLPQAQSLSSSCHPRLSSSPSSARRLCRRVALIITR